MGIVAMEIFAQANTLAFFKILAFFPKIYPDGREAPPPIIGGPTVAPTQRFRNQRSHRGPEGSG